MHTFCDFCGCSFCSWPAGFDLWCDWAFSLTSFETYSALFFFFFFAAKKPFNRGSRFLIASYAGAFRGALLSSLSTNACSTENNIPFPNLANHNYFTTLPITFQIVETWPRPLGYPIITRPAWNTGKALWPLLNVRLTIAKVIFGQILEYSVHCITLTQGKKEGKR